jgi:hypothetical protein
MAETKPMFIVLTNQKSQPLSLMSCKVVGSSSPNKFELPPTVGHGSLGGYGTDASTTPYEALWSYSPDGGKTLLNFDCKLNGEKGIQIVPSKTGPDAGNWTLGEQPRFEPGAWIVQFFYS